MRTVGEILRKARLEKKLSLEDVGNTTKITISYLEAIEANDFKQLPASAFTKGFLQNYAKVVDLNPHHVLAIFRRDYDQDDRGMIVPRSLAEAPRKSFSLMTPRASWMGLSILIGLFVVGFFARQIWLFQSAPTLELLEPGEQAQVSSPVMVTGQTQSHAQVTINNRSVAVDDAGTFEARIPLTLGEHTLIVSATSRSDKTRTIERLITVIDN